MQSKSKHVLLLGLITSLIFSQTAVAGSENKNKKAENPQINQQTKPKEKPHDKHENEKKDQDKQNHRINIQALNSPIKQNATAEFSLELPTGFLPGKAEYEIKNLDPSKKTKEKEQKVTLINRGGQWLAQIPTDNLEPGNFKIEFEVKATKSWMQTIKDYIQNIVRGKDNKHDDHPNRGEYKGEAEFAISAGPVLPPDPGEAGMLTLEGIDSDNDGVRDDVQRWIVLNHGSSEKMVAALMQSAKVHQADLTIAFIDKIKSIEVTYLGLRASRCLDYLFGLDKQIELSKLLKSQILNTDARIRANIRANANFNGQTIELQDWQKTDCDFDPDTLPN